MLWVDRNGKQTPAINEIGDYQNPAFSPDGNAVFA